MIRPVRPDRLGIVLVLASSAAFGGNAIFAKLSYKEGATVGEFLSVRFTSRRSCSGWCCGRG